MVVDGELLWAGNFEDLSSRRWEEGVVAGLRAEVFEVYSRSSSSLRRAVMQRVPWHDHSMVQGRLAWVNSQRPVMPKLKIRIYIFLNNNS